MSRYLACRRLWGNPQEQVRVHLARITKTNLKIYKIKGTKDSKNIGIWVNSKKIAAIGLRVSKWVAYHGCSININNNLKQYLKIVPCGLNNKKITSIYNELNIKTCNYNNRLINIFLKNINTI